MFLSDLIGATWASLARGMMPWASLAHGHLGTWASWHMGIFGKDDVFSCCCTFLNQNNLCCGYYLLPFLGFLLEILVHVDKDTVPFHKQFKEVYELLQPLWHMFIVQFERLIGK
jgi:hypothetical protein